GNRSANRSSGNNRSRCAAKNAYTLSPATRCPTRPSASNSSAFGSDLPCIPTSSTVETFSRTGQAQPRKQPDIQQSPRGGARRTGPAIHCNEIGCNLIDNQV